MPEVTTSPEAPQTQAPQPPTHPLPDRPQQGGFLGRLGRGLGLVQEAHTPQASVQENPTMHGKELAGSTDKNPGVAQSLSAEVGAASPVTTKPEGEISPTVHMGVLQGGRESSGLGVDSATALHPDTSEKPSISQAGFADNKTFAIGSEPEMPKADGASTVSAASVTPSRVPGVEKPYEPAKGAWDDTRGTHPDLIGATPLTSEAESPRKKSEQLNSGKAIDFKLRIGKQGVKDDEATANTEGRRQDGRLAVIVEDGTIKFTPDNSDVPEEGSLRHPVIEQYGQMIKIKRGKGIVDTFSVVDVINGKAKVRFPDQPFQLAVRNFNPEDGSVLLQKEQLNKFELMAQKLMKNKVVKEWEKACVAAALLHAGSATDTSIPDEATAVPSEASRPGITQVVEPPPPPIEVQAPKPSTEYKWQPGDVKSVDGFLDAQIALALTPKEELKDKFGLTDEQLKDMDEGKPVYLNLGDEKVNYAVARALRDRKQKTYEEDGQQKENPNYDVLHAEYERMVQEGMKKLTELNGEQVYAGEDKKEFKSHSDAEPTVVKFAPPNDFRTAVQDILAHAAEAGGVK